MHARSLVRTCVQYAYTHVHVSSVCSQHMIKHCVYMYTCLPLAHTLIHTHTNPHISVPVSTCVCVSYRVYTHRRDTSGSESTTPGRTSDSPRTRSTRSCRRRRYVGCERESVCIGCVRQRKSGWVRERQIDRQKGRDGDRERGTDSERGCL